MFQVTAYDIYKELRAFGPIQSVWGDEPRELSFTIMNVHQVKELKTRGRLTAVHKSPEPIWLRFVSEVHEVRRNRLSQHPIADILLHPPDRHANNHILNALNSECLIEIFEQKCLDFTDVNAIAATCKRFHKLAKYVLTKHYPNEILSDLSTIKERHPHLWQIDNYLFNLGRSIRTVKTEYHSHVSDILLGLLAEYNCGKTMTKMTIALNSLAHPWQKYDRLFGYNSNLEVWHIISNVTSIVTFPRMRFPKLRTLMLTNVRISDWPDTIDFFQVNAHITQMVLNNIQFTNRSPNALREIRHLKSVRFSDPDHSTTKQNLFELSVANVQLERLIFDQFPDGEDQRQLFMTISGFKRLKKLSIRKSYGTQMIFNCLLQTMRWLVELRSIDITARGITFNNIERLLKAVPYIKKGTFAMYRDTVRWTEMFSYFDAIERIVQQRENDLRLSVKLLVRNVSDPIPYPVRFDFFF